MAAVRSAATSAIALGFSMADDDDQGTSSGSRANLVLPKAPGPAQPLSHVASRHRKKLDAALSAGGYYDVAHGRESARAHLAQLEKLAVDVARVLRTRVLVAQLTWGETLD